MSRYIGSEGSMDKTAEEALAGFDGFPDWMWKNTRTAKLVEDLRGHNARARTEREEADALLAAERDFRAAGASAVQLAEAGLRSEVNTELNFPPNFEGLVLGCIDADFCK